MILALRKLPEGIPFAGINGLALSWLIDDGFERGSPISSKLIGNGRASGCVVVIFLGGRLDPICAVIR